MNIIFIILIIIIDSMFKISSFSINQRIISKTKISTKFFCTNINNENKPKVDRNGIGKAKGYGGSTAPYELEYHNLSGLPLKNPKNFTVLGIETSCDDTAVAIVRSDGKILSNIVYSQYSIHEKFGGIVPGLAMESHKNNIDKAIENALKESGLNSIDDIDAIAVTKGPGLEICLRIGLRKAQELAEKYNKPFITVHHLEAHCVITRLVGENINQNADSVTHVNSTSRINPTSTSHIDSISLVDSKSNNDISKPFLNNFNNNFQPKIEYPYLALLVSGGHTSILICKGIGQYDVLGGTLDDALGEAFDKISRLLGLITSGSPGAAVEKYAKLGNKNKYKLKIPMKEKKNCDFSYAGLKNSFRLLVDELKVTHNITINNNNNNSPIQSMKEVNMNDIILLPNNIINDLCASFQNIAITHIEERILHSFTYIFDHKIHINGITVVGGVGSNQELRNRLISILKQFNLSHLPLIVPPASLCTDNGVMVAWTAIEKINLGISDEIKDQEPISRWPLGAMLPRTENPPKKKKDSLKISNDKSNSNETKLIIE